MSPFLETLMKTAGISLQDLRNVSRQKFIMERVQKESPVGSPLNFNDRKLVMEWAKENKEVASRLQPDLRKRTDREWGFFMVKKVEKLNPIIRNRVLKSLHGEDERK